MAERGFEAADVAAFEAAERPADARGDAVADCERCENRHVASAVVNGLCPACRWREAAAERLGSDPERVAFAIKNGREAAERAEASGHPALARMAENRRERIARLEARLSELVRQRDARAPAGIVADALYLAERHLSGAGPEHERGFALGVIRKARS